MELVPRGSRNSEPGGTQRARNVEPSSESSKLRRRGVTGDRAFCWASFRRRTGASDEPEGSRDPDGEQEPESFRNAGRGASNGLRALIFPADGRPGGEERSPQPNGLVAEVSGASKEQARNYEPGEVVRKRTAAPGERKAVPRRRLRRRGCLSAFGAPIRSGPKAAAGSKEGGRQAVLRCRVRAVHAGWRTSCKAGHLEPFFLAAPKGADAIPPRKLRLSPSTFYRSVLARSSSSAGAISCAGSAGERRRR